MYKVHFKGYLDLGLDYDDLEDMYEKAFGSSARTHRHKDTPSRNLMIQSLLSLCFLLQQDW